MALRNRLGGHSNSYHTYSLEEALEGIAAAGYKFVELSAVRGWTEHVPLEADAKTLGRIQRMMNKLGLMSLSLSGHSDLTTKDGLKDGLKAVDVCERMGIEIMNTAIGGHYSESEDEEAFMGNIRLAPIPQPIQPAVTPPIVGPYLTAEFDGGGDRRLQTLAEASATRVSRMRPIPLAACCAAITTSTLPRALACLISARR